jgi:uncharacterized protein YicC (UPF0701 family)
MAALKEIIYKAVEQVVSFRIQEGKSVENVFLTKISNIDDYWKKFRLTKRKE